jgi:hypothetical protein
MNKPITDEQGFTYFEALPNCFRIATEADFIDCKPNKPLLEENDNGDKWYCYRVKFPDVIMQSIETSLKLNKIFVCK